MKNVDLCVVLATIHVGERQFVRLSTTRLSAPALKEQLEIPRSPALKLNADQTETVPLTENAITTTVSVHVP